MTANGITKQGRAAALRLMVDACTITRETGRITNPDTGGVMKQTTTVYTGQCRVQQAGATAGPSDIGEAQLDVQDLILQLPTTVTGVLPDDLVTITASALDPDLSGRLFHTRGLGHKTHATARRYQLIEVTG